MYVDNQGHECFVLCKVSEVRRAASYYGFLLSAENNHDHQRENPQARLVSKESSLGVAIVVVAVAGNSLEDRLGLLFDEGPETAKVL